MAVMPPRLGVDSFSFHRWFGEVNQWEQPLEERWATKDLLAHVAGLGLDVLSLQTSYLPPLTPSVVAELREGALHLGTDIILAWGHRSGLQDGRSVEKLADALASMQAARDLGCDIVRVVCGDQGSWTEDAGVRAANLERLRAPLDAISARAEDLGLLVAVENHADRPTAELLALVSSVGSPRLGLCFDVANAVRVGDDAVASALAAAPLTFMAQLRDLRLGGGVRRGPADWWPCTALGRGDLDIPSVLAALLSSSRCTAWLVEASNVVPGDDEREMVTSSLSYLRSFLSDTRGRPPAARRARPPGPGPTSRPTDYRPHP
jgi:3-oxoisoapionate decarboxylase